MQSKLQDQNTMARLSQRTTSATTSSAVTMTPSLLSVKLSEYPSVNQWPHHNSKACYLPEELVARAKRNWKSISVLTLAKASVPPDKVLTCWLRATLKSIMARLSLPMMEERRQRLLSGPNRLFMRRFASTYSIISTANPSGLPTLNVSKLLWEETTEIAEEPPNHLSPPNPLCKQNGLMTRWILFLDG